MRSTDAKLRRYLYSATAKTSASLQKYTRGQRTAPKSYRFATILVWHSYCDTFYDYI